MQDKLVEHKQYIAEYGLDMPEIRDGISDKKAFLLIKYTHTKRDFRLFGSSFFVHKNIPRLATRDKKC